MNSKLTQPNYLYHLKLDSTKIIIESDHRRSMTLYDSFSLDTTVKYFKIIYNQILFIIIISKSNVQKYNLTNNLMAFN